MITGLRYKIQGQEGVSSPFHFVVAVTTHHHPTKISTKHNQLGRRNLTKFQKSKLALQKEELLKQEAKKRQKLSKGRGKKGVAIFPHLLGEKGKTRDKLAKKAWNVHDVMDGFAT